MSNSLVFGVADGFEVRRTLTQIALMDMYSGTTDTGAVFDSRGFIEGVLLHSVVIASMAFRWMKKEAMELIYPHVKS